MNRKHPLTIYVYQSGLTRDEGMKPALYTPHISNFARQSQGFINVMHSAYCLGRVGVGARHAVPLRPRYPLPRFFQLRSR